MSNQKWSDFHLLQLGPKVSMKLPLVTDDKGSLYSINLMGATRLNRQLAAYLFTKLEEAWIDYDVIVCAESKSIALVQELSSLALHSEAVIVRKHYKRYMSSDSQSVVVHPITHSEPEELWLDSLDCEVLEGKRILLVDDVVSTGSTIEGVRELLKKSLKTYMIVAVTCIVTEGGVRTEINGIPLISLDDIPFPGVIQP